ncbi:MAG: phosphoglycerate kinase [bacterium]
MRMNKKSITDVDLHNKKVIMRADFNVPLKNGIISDNARIVAALPTIEYILRQNASLILMSHLGRPKGERKPELSLKPIAKELEKLIGRPVQMADDCIGDNVTRAASALKNGEVMMLENVRFYKEEDTKTDAEGRKGFAKKLASLADVYVNDAFGTAHREHASTANIAEFLPAVCGKLMEKEITFLGKAVNNPERPLLAILGGAKVSDKIPIIENLLIKADKIIIGGGMTYTFYKAKGYEVGQSLVDESLVDKCGEFMEKGKEKLLLPIDNMVTSNFDFNTMKCTEALEPAGQNIPSGKIALDIGEESIAAFKETIAQVNTIVWNGPMGVFECSDTAKGTFAIAHALAEASARGATTIIGGGDSASAIKKAGLVDKVTHVSTGGGASMEFLEGKKLPGIEALEDK